MAVARRVEPVGEQAQVEAPQAAGGEAGEDPGERRGKHRDVAVVELGDRRTAAEDRHRIAEHPDRGERHEPGDAPGLADPPRPATFRFEEIARERAARPRRVSVRRDQHARHGVAGRGGDHDLHVGMNLRPAGRRHVVPRDDPVGTTPCEPRRDEAREVACGGQPVDDEAFGHRVHRMEMFGAQHCDARDVVVREEVRKHHRRATLEPPAGHEIVGKPRRDRRELAGTERTVRVARLDHRGEVGRRRSLEREVTDARRLAGERVIAHLGLDLREREALARVVQARELLLGAEVDHRSGAILTAAQSRTTTATPTTASTNPASASGPSVSPNRKKAMDAVTGGTR